MTTTETTKAESRTSNTFTSGPFAWYENLDATLEFLQDPAFAIRFALDHVEPFMVRGFMEDWQEDRDAGEARRTRYFLESLKESIEYGQMVDEKEDTAQAAKDTAEPDYSDMRAFSRNLAAWGREHKAQQDADRKN